MNQSLAIYIHWPFCKSKCPYCDFNSHVRTGVEQERWQRALLTELETQAGWLSTPHSVSSIFFGGGTPSLMPTDTVAALIARIRTLWPVADDLEITLEANPTSVEAQNFAALRTAGVNRLSLGVQSLRAEGLRFLGREHSVSEALAAVECAQSIFPRTSFDLIYARPGQSVAAWEEELREALPFIGGHASMYQLTIEEETPFARVHAAGAFTLPEDDVAAEMYEITEDILADIGLSPYEISNYARPGEACRHNLNIWRGGEYVGVGPGAHGRSFFGCPPLADTPLPMGQSSGLGRPTGLPSFPHPQTPNPESLTATSTLKSPERWLAQVEREGHGLEQITPLTPEERREECLLMGLRLAEGIAYDTASLNQAALKQCVEYGLLEAAPHHLRLTQSGRLLLDAIIGMLVT